MQRATSLRDVKRRSAPRSPVRLSKYSSKRVCGSKPDRCSRASTPVFRAPSWRYPNHNSNRSRAGLEELNVQIRQAELDLQRTQGLAQRKLASAADLDRDRLTLEGLHARLDRQRSDVVVAQRGVAVNRQLLDDMEIRAPFTGIVVAKAAQPGEMISPISAGGGFTRTGICTIVDMDSLEVEVDVNEAYINRVQPKQPVSVTLNAYPDDRIPAEVIAIIPTADRNKATVRVRIGLLEKNAKVLPDMGVKVAFLDDKSAKS